MMFSLLIFASLCLFSTAKPPRWIFQFIFSNTWDFFRVAYGLGHTQLNSIFAPIKKFKGPVIMVHPKGLDVLVCLQCIPESQSRWAKCQKSNRFASKSEGKQTKNKGFLLPCLAGTKGIVQNTGRFSHLKNIWMRSGFFSISNYLFKKNLPGGGGGCL